MPADAPEAAAAASSGSGSGSAGDERREGQMNHSSSSGAAATAAEWDDSAGEMDSEDNHAATVVGMMEVDADAHDPVDVLADLDRHPAALPVDADFFNSFPDDFDDQDLA